MKKRSIWILVISMMFILLVGCGQGGTAPGDGQEASDSEFDAVWYELEPNSGVLTVCLPDENQGFTWAFVIADESVLELLTQETTEDQYVASFRALADGDTQITFSYFRNDELNEVRVIALSCKDGKVVKITSDGTVDMTGAEDDTRVSALRAANSLLTVLKEHDAVTCVSENWDGENSWQYSAVTQFTRNGGRLWFDYEQSDESGEVVYSQAGYINDDVPGAYYEATAEGMKYMELYAASEYEAFIADHWLKRNNGDYETVLEEKTSEEYHATALTARRTNDITGVYSDVTYFIDTETGLITGLEETEYSPEDGSVTSVTRSNIFYDEPRMMEEGAAFSVLFPEDPCNLRLIINPGAENEEEQQFQVSKSTQVEFAALERFEMFYDYACTQPMEWIDVSQNDLTVYIALDPTKAE